VAHGVIDVFEVVYPEYDIPYKLEDLGEKLGVNWESDDKKRKTLELIASACNSVRSAILTFHRYIEQGKLGKIVPVDIQGSTHEQARKILTGEKGDFKIDYSKFLDYCLVNKVPTNDVSDFVMLSEMAKQRRLAKVDEKFRDQMRSKNPIIYAPKIKAKAYFWTPKQKEKEKKEERKPVYKKTGIKVRKKSNVSIDNLW